MRLMAFAAAMALFAQSPIARAQGGEQIPAEISGAWKEAGGGAGMNRMATRRGRLILIEEGRSTHGRLEKDEKGYVFNIDFVDGRPEKAALRLELRREGEKLVLIKDGVKRFFERLEGNASFPRAVRAGFSYVAPDGWVSNVTVFARRTGREPESFDADQLVHFYEVGVGRPTESVTLKLLDEPFGQVMEDVAGKLKHPGLKSVRKDAVIGGREWAVFENSMPAGEGGVSARVCIARWDGGKTLVIAAPALLPGFPGDLARDLEALVDSLRPEAAGGG